MQNGLTALMLAIESDRTGPAETEEIVKYLQLATIKGPDAKDTVSHFVCIFKFVLFT